MSPRRAVALGACAVVACGCGAKKTVPPPERLVARQTASGPHASATASADAGHYASFTVRVTASPAQRVTGGWVVSCRVGTSSSRDSRDFRGRTPVVAHTSPLAGQQGCTVVATATLAQSGSVTVRLLGVQ
jgi:hypothetical protein